MRDVEPPKTIRVVVIVAGRTITMDADLCDFHMRNDPEALPEERALPTYSFDIRGRGTPIVDRNAEKLPQ